MRARVPDVRAAPGIEGVRPERELTLKAAALRLGYVSEAEFDRVVDPRRMVHPYVATENPAA